MTLISGLIIGILFGYILKRSRFCMTGLTRDILMEKKPYHFVIMLAIIAIQGWIYFAMGHAGWILIPGYLPPFSLLSVGLGSFLFGVGAVLMNGCLTSTLVKCGDGRIIGWMGLAIFMLVGTVMSAGFGRPLTRAVRSVAVVSDDLALRRQFATVYIFGALTIITVIVMLFHARKHRPAFTMPQRFHGVRHLVFEKRWNLETAAICMGVLMGITYLVCEQFGRHNGFAMATPVLSWVYMFLKPDEIIGGCNPFDQVFGWSSLFVLGIVVGVFLTTVGGGEFSIVKPARGIIAKGIVGAVLMGVGAVWGQGCLISNALVGTAQVSLKSWYAALFLIAGIWTATKVFLMREDS